MRSAIRIILPVFISAVILTACNKFDDNKNNEPDQESGIEELNIAGSFDWESSREILIKIGAQDNRGNPMGNVKFSLFTDDPEKGGKFIFSGTTASNGIFKRNYEVPAYYDSLTVMTDYVGLPNMIRVPLTSNGLDFTFGGDIKYVPKSAVSPKNLNYDFVYLGGYDFFGVPDYLEEENDEITQDLLDDINNTLPEKVRLDESHPQYFDEQYKHNLVLQEMAEVFVTFVHEGAGYKNVLGFYTFDKDNPPASPDDIDEITIIFPNTSYQYSGGGLVAGNKVRLGVFPAGTEIGWVLFANGFNGEVTTGLNTFYSNQEFNPENDPSLRQHSVFLNDIGRELILLGFEDLHREEWCDHDFNDAVYYVTVNPFTAVDMSDLAQVDYTGDDADEDGVSDNLDDYPEDPDRAFDNYFFTQGTYGTLAYEDMWPGTGDYDFNDMVIDYNFNQVTNAENKVVEVYGEFILKAFGASFHNGFGIDLGISPNLVANVTGYEADASWVDLNDKGLENNQSNAVIIVFDDAYDLMSHTGGIGVNTNPNFAFVTPDTINIKITLNEAVDLNDIGIPPYNPFMIVNQVRGHEIHLSDHAPTDLVDNSLFGTYRDDSDPASGRYYKTENNLPWGIKLIEPFEYPVEKVEVVDAYLKFAAWAEGAGSIFNDWYKDESGYRNAGNIYQTP